MALTTSGTLSIGMINAELGRAIDTPNSSLSVLANLAKTSSTPYLNRALPKISHWYGYVHAVADTTAPPLLSKFTATSNSCYVSLLWTAVTDNSGLPVMYEIFRDNVYFAETDWNGYDDDTYDIITRSYKVRARDAAGNVSSFTQSIARRALTCN